MEYTKADRIDETKNKQAAAWVFCGENADIFFYLFKNRVRFIPVI